MKGGSGSAGGGGYEFQARSIAYVAAHALVGEPLNWLETLIPDIPIAVSAETGGPGDDFRTELSGHVSSVEIQAKRGLKRDKRFWEVIQNFGVALAADSSVYLALAIDPTASNSIKSLRDDFLRLRQGRLDGLREITLKVLERFSDIGMTSPQVIADHFFVVDVDIEADDSRARRRAIELLRHALVNPAQADAAWDVLQVIGLELIRMRGRLDAESVIRRLKLRGIEIVALSPSAVTARYLEWLHTSTSAYRVPGLGKSLNIETAWIQLGAIRTQVEPSAPETLEAKLAAYHEWERLAHSHNTNSAQDLVAFGRRVVVIGGPGSGKSTLCRRVAHQLSGEGKHVVRVNLPAITRHLDRGETINEAILAVATEGLGVPSSALVSMFSSPECLLADGLDECGPSRERIADLLCNWALGRPQTRVIVTTRPIGHNPAWFPKWEHAELLPLSTDYVIKHAATIIEALTANSEDTAAHLKQFKERIENNRLASMAARSPLLLGFLVQLSFAGVPFPATRTGLYAAILRLWRDVPDRDSRTGTTDLDSPTTERSLNIIGWILRNATADGARSEIVEEKLGLHLANEMGLAPLAGRSLASRCLHFWRERGVLEQVRVGYLEAYTFVHFSLEEYCAACYAATLETEHMGKWLIRTRREAAWHDVITMTAGAGALEPIVTRLLALDDVGDPAATESLLAASALAEVADPPLELAEVVADRIASRLTSYVPLVAYESAINALGLAARVPDHFAPLLGPLLGHPQEWTRLAALRLVIATANVDAALDALETCLDEGWGEGQDHGLVAARDTAWGIWNEVVELGGDVLARLRPGEVTAERLKKVALSRRISLGAQSALDEDLIALGHPEVAHKHLEDTRRSFDWILGLGQYATQWWNADRAFLEAVQRVAGVHRGSTADSEHLQSLGILVHGMEIPKLPTDSWVALGRRNGQAALDTAIRGAAAALEIDLAELAKDAAQALMRVQASEADTIYAGGLLAWLPEIPVEPDWTLAINIGLDPKALVKGVEHPSLCVGYTAANLLCAGAGRLEAPRLVEDLLPDANEQTMRVIAAIASDLWGSAANAKLITRMQGALSPGCLALIEHFGRLPDVLDDVQVVEALVSAVRTDDVRLATTSAEVLLKCPGQARAPYVEELRTALAYWTRRGTTCKHCGALVLEGSCETCHIVPESPRANLIRVLVQHETLNVDQALQFCTDPRHDVVNAGSEAVRMLLAQNWERLPSLIVEVGDGAQPVSVLSAILGLPASILMSVRADLLTLASSPRTVVRKRLLSAISTATWIEQETARTVARAAFDDPDIEVRNQAVRTVRQLEETFT